MANSAFHLRWFFAVVLLLLGACSTTPQGRPQITTPAPIGDLYSFADMRLHLAVATGVGTPCKGLGCEADKAFDQQIQRLGARLAISAYDTYPDLIKRVGRFEFAVAEKAPVGSDSTATGNVVIYRGVQQLHFDDLALAFLMAREMGHIISHHHDENTATRLMFSVAAGILFPALNLFNGSATLAQATSATSTSAATTAASSATSFLGSEIALANIKPDQLSEADTIALQLLEQMGWNTHNVARALETSRQIQGDSAWAKDFRVSVHRLKVMDVLSGIAPADLELGVFVPEADPLTELPALTSVENEVVSEEVDLTDALWNPAKLSVATGKRKVGVRSAGAKVALKGQGKAPQNVRPANNTVKLPLGAPAKQKVVNKPLPGPNAKAGPGNVVLARDKEKPG